MGIKAARSFLVILLVSTLIFLPGHASAQTVACFNEGFPNPPWTYSGADRISSSPTDYLQSNTQPPNILLNIDLAQPIWLNTVRFVTFETASATLTGFGSAQTFYHGVVVETKQFLLGAPFTWYELTGYFSGQPVDRIYLTFSDLTSPVLISVGSMEICGAPLWTPTPSETFTPTFTPTWSPTPSRTPTPTRTPTPSNTPTPSHTPTATFTPSETDTPTAGPSPTETNTFLPSNTPTTGPSPTPTEIPALPPPTLTTNLENGRSVFGSPAPPQQCSDVFNPCGELPYALPQFGTLVLASPTGIPVTSIFPTGTLMGTPTPFGTFVGTVTPAGPTVTGTFNAGQDQVAAYATNAVNTNNTLIATPGLFDPTGPLATLPDTANQVGSYVGDFFGIVRAVQGFFLGKTGTIIAFLLLILLYILLVRLILFALPIIMKVFDLLLQLIQAIIP